ncbi:DUF3459 domain-containing protein [Streptomyces sp. TG1A-8]|uniref:DUF3459 domain-containing protein n=1 Tax=Streptomyces sp. TG1A-8 TaxID=3051385 RepID=UPI00265BE570|nr:DUF3459 domain-containing protein [Streptomyces sp. TG1A-8]MDO0929437.1 DUF3459 domain-containing protein [Streptomyces sp. TG1A-8]
MPCTQTADGRAARPAAKLGSWLPQPDGWGEMSVEAQDAVPGFPLELYRAALRLRRELVRGEDLTWIEEAGGATAGALAFDCGGWRCAANLSAVPAPLPAGEVLLASSPCDGREPPPWTTVWLRGTETADATVG